VSCAKGITELHRTLNSAVNFGPGVERHTGVSQASREPAGWQQWAEHRLEAVRKGQKGQTGVTDFGPGVERFGGPCAKGK